MNTMQILNSKSDRGRSNVDEVIDGCSFHRTYKRKNGWEIFSIKIVAGGALNSGAPAKYVQKGMSREKTRSPQFLLAN